MDCERCPGVDWDVRAQSFEARLVERLLVIVTGQESAKHLESRKKKE